MNIKYPLAKETINNEDIDALREWLGTYPRLTKGELTWKVEDAWADYIGTEHAVFNNSGSSANLLMIYTAMAAGRIKNKKIAVPSVGWVTTIAPAIQFGLTPIMIGADKNTYGMDLNQPRSGLRRWCKSWHCRRYVFIFILLWPSAFND